MVRTADSTPQTVVGPGCWQVYFFTRPVGGISQLFIVRLPSFRLSFDLLLPWAESNRRRICFQTALPLSYKASVYIVTFAWPSLAPPCSGIGSFHSIARLLFSGELPSSSIVSAGNGISHFLLLDRGNPHHLFPGGNSTMSMCSFLRRRRDSNPRP